MPSSGDKVKQFELLEPLAKGGMGEVFLAQDTKLDRKVAIKFLPEVFVRAGSSDGGGEDAVSVGVGISTVYDDELSIGFGWSRPSEKTFGRGLRDETAFEVSYRLQMSPNATLMPDVQLILNPANNADSDRVWVVSLRLRWDI